MELYNALVCNVLNLMVSIKIFFTDLFIKFTRYLEYLISGQSGYSITTADDFSIKDGDNVDDNVIAVKLLKDIKKILQRKYSVYIKSPVVLEVVSNVRNTRVPFVWKENGIGKYHSQMMLDEKYHMIYVVSGLSKYKFCTIIAHELMHAFLYEQELFTENQHFREAMARWIEYHFLLLYGLKEQAQKLLDIKEMDRGGGLVKLLELEKKTGETGLIPYLIRKKDSLRREV